MQAFSKRILLFLSKGITLVAMIDDHQKKATAIYQKYHCKIVSLKFYESDYPRLDRYKTEAQKRGLSLSAFLKRAADMIIAQEGGQDMGAHDQPTPSPRRADHLAP